VVFSLVLNLLVLSSLDLSWIAPEARREVSLAALGAREWEANRQVGPPAARPARPPPVAGQARPEQPPDPEVAGKQIVDIGGPDENAPKPDAKETKYLAQRDSRVEKETRSRHTGLFPATAPRPVVVPQSGAKGAPDARPDPSRGRREQKARPQLALNLPDRGSLTLPRPETGTPGDQGGDADRPPAPGSAGPMGRPEADGKGKKLDLQPRAALLEQMAGGPAADHLPDVEEGEATFLNTNQWKYAGYFNRIGQQLQIQWRSEGQAQVEARDPTGQRFLYKDRFVVMDVTLDDHGAVRDVRVVRSTGIDFLDRVAVDMFKRAEVFANPPAGIIDASGRIQLTYGINFVGVSPSVGLLRRPSFHE
jgi:TonB family protein